MSDWKNNTEKKINIKEKTIGIVVSRFNDFVTTKLLDDAIEALKHSGMKEENIPVLWVPGAFEIPIAVKSFRQKCKCDAIICLGAVIRGETPHFDYVSQASSYGIMRVGLDLNIPVIFGVLTTDTVEQAMNRISKGGDAASTALEMLELFEEGIVGNKT